MREDTKKLIEDLAGDTESLTPAPPVRARFFAWMAISCICLSVGVVFAHPRRDLQELITDPMFLVEAISIISTALFAGLTALILSVPGLSFGKAKRAFLWSVIGWVISFTIAVSYRISFSPQNMQHFTHGFLCSRTLILFSLVPAVALFGLVRIASPQQMYAAGFFLLLSAGLIGTLGVELTCPSDDFLHIVIFHFLPPVVLGAVGMVVGRRFLQRKWKKPSGTENTER
ncbi:MAG: DUF1109 domain-containing protein [Bdellovibrionales bacterium]|nr:DUF1109 domain-containing protein [Bdellovibrionales bacterium]